MHTRNDQRNQRDTRRSAPRARDSRTPRITRTLSLDGLEQPTQPVIKVAKTTPKLARSHAAQNDNCAHIPVRIAPEAEPFHVAYLESAIDWLWRAHTAIGTIYHAYPLDDPRALELSHILVRLDMALFKSQSWVDVFGPNAPLPEGA